MSGHHVSIGVISLAAIPVLVNLFLVKLYTCGSDFVNVMTFVSITVPYPAKAVNK